MVVKGKEGSEEKQSVSPYHLVNIRLFILFRVLFNARFYYPVFTILFLDYGLTLEQFAVLNTVWAFTIVLSEVPSGALADLLGRRFLLVVTAWLMIFEMAVIAFVPAANPDLVFWAFLINRVLSGLAEAMASGADEALAYDTLVVHGLAGQWPRVLEVQMRAQNFGYIIAMTLGAVVYDPSVVNRVLQWCSVNVSVSQQMSMRYPLYLTLILAVFALFVTLRMRDPSPPAGHRTRDPQKATIWQLLRLVLRTGAWIIRTPMAFTIIFFAMTIDHTLRMGVTLTSKYYRLIGLPEASFGLLGSLVAVVGLFVPRLARIMVERLSFGLNVFLLGAGSVIALLFLSLFVPYWGILPVIAIFVGLMLTSYFTSHYLNELTDSQQRATVLSFKGLALNVAYGIIGLAFAALMQHYRVVQTGLHPSQAVDFIEDQAFVATVGCFPWYLAGALILTSLCCLPRVWRRRSTGRKQ
ncbi:MFS transporter [Desulfobulbus oligotrophicus]|uniref:MFS transporter n=1 Tax=Desulfobulbus oligotrophicus TaxID=1909699 RepID=A0A7T6AQB7_9BACT|nr:MFS transporter [Desulfobulbus oligotrophicus]